MDLRAPNPRLHAARIGDALTHLPNKDRLIALESTLPYLTKNEIESAILELFILCQPPSDPIDASPIRALARRVFAPIVRKRDEADRLVARAAQRHIIRRWDQLTPEHRRLALAAEGVNWTARARELLAEEPDAIRQVGQLLADCAPPAPAKTEAPTQSRGVFFNPEAPTTANPPKTPDDETLTLMLRSGNRDAIAAAERDLLARIAAAVTTPPEQRPASLREIQTAPPEVTQRKQAIRSALAAARLALDTHDAHERTPLALACLLLLDRPASDPDRALIRPVAEALANPDHPAFTALRRALKREPSPATRRIAWRALTPGPLTIACLERLAGARTDADHTAVLELAHLAANPARRDLLASLGAPAARTPEGARSARKSTSPNGALATLLPPATADLTPAAERGLAVLITAADDRSARAIRDRLLTSPNEHARLTAARLASSADLADDTFDASPEIARLAALRRSPVGVRPPSTTPDAAPRLRLTRLLTRSPHEDVRAVAHRDLEDSELLTREGAPTLRSIALAQRDPAALAEALAPMLASAESGERVRAIRAAVRLRIVDRWTDALTQILETPATTADEARVAATAAAALGAIPSRLVLPTVLAVLERPDPRVRANAVESLERIAGAVETDLADRFSEIKRSPEHRARANAIRALERLRLADADDTHEQLADMLGDDRTPHRLAGVWLAERMLCDPRRALGPGDSSWQTAARGVAALARDDDDPHTRARAARCARRLLAEVSRPRGSQRDPAIDRAASKIRALAERHAAPESLTDEQASANAAEACA